MTLSLADKIILRKNLPPSESQDMFGVNYLEWTHRNERQGAQRRADQYEVEINGFIDLWKREALAYVNRLKLN